MTVRAVLFDFSGTLFRLEEEDSWFAGMELVDDEGRRAVDAHAKAELMNRLTHPTGRSVEMDEQTYRAWLERDLAPHLHREAYLHVLRASGLTVPHAEALYHRVVDPDSWTPYPDTAEALHLLRVRGIKTAVVSNIAFDVRPAFTAAGTAADEYVLSFELGAAKPDPLIFREALDRLEIAASDAVMVGDSEENDGASRGVGIDFILVDPLPTDQRRTGLLDALAGRAISR